MRLPFGPLSIEVEATPPRLAPYFHFEGCTIGVSLTLFAGGSMMLPPELGLVSIEVTLPGWLADFLDARLP